MTQKTLSEQVNEVLKSRMSADKKAQALVKLGTTPFEAMILAKASMPKMVHTPRRTFTYTFGVEMETYNCDPEDFSRAVQEYGLSFVNHMGAYLGCHTDIPHFKLVPDGSLTGHNTAECVTPALKGNTAGFKALENCCRALCRVGARANSSCGVHVHIGAKDLSDQEYCNVFVNYKRLEQAIDTFMSHSRRANSCRWARTLTDHDLESCQGRGDVLSCLASDRYHKVNPCSWGRHRTIEFRQHQGSVNYKKISSWVKFLGKLVEYSRYNRIDRDIDRIEDIPFLTQAEKNFFIGRRSEIEARDAR